MLPALIIMICFVVEIGNQWYGRVQAETSLEAAALTAVKQWADGTPTATLAARCHGVEYAKVNPAGGQAVTITANYDNVAPIAANQNNSPDGNLIFGAITNDEAPWVFNANVVPSCGPGTVLLDASGNGNLNAQNNEWGIAYQKTDTTSTYPPIRSIEINLGAGNPMYFDSSSFQYGDGAPAKVSDGTDSQPNFSPGFTSTATDISRIFGDPATQPNRYKKLTFFFPDASTTPATFDACERFRFGVDVRRASGGQQFDGDDIGQNEVQVKVTFDNGQITTGNFIDTKSNNSTCLKTGNDSNCPASIIIFNNIADLPCAPVPGQGNNPDGQSYVQVGGSGGNKYAVLAQGEIAIPTLCENLFGIGLPQSKVFVRTFAMFDCSEPSNPRLIRVLDTNYTAPVIP